MPALARDLSSQFPLTYLAAAKRHFSIAGDVEVFRANGVLPGLGAAGGRAE